MKKNVFRVILAVVLVATVVVFTVNVGAVTAAHYKRGTYEGGGRGKFSDVVLSVKIRRGKNTAIDVISQNETPNDILIDEEIPMQSGTNLLVKLNSCSESERKTAIKLINVFMNYINK